MNVGRQTGEGQPFAREMTVARIRDRGAHWTDVVFLESAQVYRLSKSHSRFDALLSRLRTAEAAKTPVTVFVASPSSDIIEDVSSR